MIKLALAIACGIIAIVTLAHSIVKSVASKYPVVTDVDEFLDRMERTREERYDTESWTGFNRLRDFRSAWYAYEDEYAYNFSMD